MSIDDEVTRDPRAAGLVPQRQMGSTGAVVVCIAVLAARTRRHTVYAANPSGNAIRCAIVADMIRRHAQVVNVRRKADVHEHADDGCRRRVSPASGSIAQTTPSAPT